MKNTIYIIGILMITLIVPNVLGDKEAMYSNITINVLSNITCSNNTLSGGYDINVVPEGGFVIWNSPLSNLPPSTTIYNGYGVAVFLGELNCNNTVTADLIKNCNNYFNESCNGFPCQSSWLVCESELNQTKNWFGNGSDPISILGNVTTLYTNCMQQKQSSETGYTTCNTNSITNDKTICMSGGGTWDGSNCNRDLTIPILIGISCLAIGAYADNKYFGNKKSGKTLMDKLTGTGSETTEFFPSDKK